MTQLEAEMNVMGLLNESGTLLDRVKANPEQFRELANELQKTSQQLYQAALSARGINVH